MSLGGASGYFSGMISLIR